MLKVSCLHRDSIGICNKYYVEIVKDGATLHAETHFFPPNSSDIFIRKIMVMCSRIDWMIHLFEVILYLKEFRSQYNKYKGTWEETKLTLYQD
jgi:hypothetical protein